MPVQSDFSLTKFEDGVLAVGMSPPFAVGGMGVTFTLLKRVGGVVPLATKSVASGYGGGASGITVTNSGQGAFTVGINSVDTSGLDPGNYAYSVVRTDSGNRTVIAGGYLTLLPGSLGAG